MKASTSIAMSFLAGMLAFTSCSKDDSSQETPTPTPAPAPVTPSNAKMESTTGTWKSSGADMPADEQSTYSDMTLKVNADSTCTWTKTHKTNPMGTLVMTGKMFYEVSDEKDATGKPIDRIWFSFNKINGENLPGSTHGIYQVNGKKMTIDWQFMRSGVKYADPAKGFGSSDQGTKTVSTYSKQ